MATATALPAPRHRILAAARKRFEQFGYRRTSIGEIARDAGIAVGTVYRYFDTKEAIFFAAAEETIEAWLAAARRALATPGTAVERLARLGMASLEFNQQSTLVQSILDRDTEIVFAPHLDQLGATLLERNVALIADVVRDGIREGSLRDVDPATAAFVLFVGGDALRNQKHRPYHEVLPLYMEITMQGLVRR
jgi:AcrR family transcriptional regulator